METISNINQTASIRKKYAECLTKFKQLETLLKSKDENSILHFIKKLNTTLTYVLDQSVRKMDLQNF
jgi:hypothetical protein